MTIRPVRPSAAASLVLMRRNGRVVEVLMGRRAPGHSFLPHFYVFPGGRLDASDARMTPATALRTRVADRMGRAQRGAPHQALALAAIRETAEESGLLLGSPAALPESVPDAWRAFAAQGLLPALDALDYVGRAITPSAMPKRFDSRFFLAEAGRLAGTLGGSGELLDLAWRSIEASLALALADVTEFMLAEAAAVFDAGAGSARGAPLFTYRRGRVHVRRD